MTEATLALQESRETLGVGIHPVLPEHLRRP